MALYLDVADAGTLPEGWSKFARFGLSVINQKDPKKNVEQGQLGLLFIILDRKLKIKKKKQKKTIHSPPFLQNPKSGSIKLKPIGVSGNLCH